MADSRQLEQYLDAAGQERMTLRFEELERVLGEALPSEARQSSAWWIGTSATEPQLRLSRWVTERVYPHTGVVTFTCRG